MKQASILVLIAVSAFTVLVRAGESGEVIELNNILKCSALNQEECKACCVKEGGRFVSHSTRGDIDGHIFQNLCVCKVRVLKEEIPNVCMDHKSMDLTCEDCCTFNGLEKVFNPFGCTCKSYYY